MRPRVSLPQTSPTLRWTGEVGDALVFRIWGSRAFVRDSSADKLSARAIPCIFLGFPPDAPGWQFYHPTSRSVFSSQDVTIDESVPFYRLFPYRSAPPPPSPLFLAPGPPPVDPFPLQGPAPSGVFQVDPLPGTARVEVAVGSGASRGAESGGAEPGGAKPVGAELADVEPGGGEPEGVEPKGAEFEGAESKGAEPRGTASSGAAGAGDSAAGDTGAGGDRLPAGAGGAASAGPGGARTRGTGAAGTGGVWGAGAGDSTKPGAAGIGGTGAVDAGAGGTGAGGAGAGGAGGAVGILRPRPYFVPLLQQVLGVSSSIGLTPPFLCPPLDQSQPPLQPAPPLPALSPYTEQTSDLTERREPASRPASPVRTGRRVTRPRPPPNPGTHAVALPPSSVPQRVSLPSSPEASLPIVPDPESDRARAASPVVSRLLTTVVTDPSFGSVSASPPSVEGECALGTDVLENRQEDFECLAAVVPRFASMLLAPEGDPDAPDIPTLRSYAEAITGTLVNAVPPSRVNIVDDMWIFRVNRPPGSPPAFKSRYVATDFSQRQGVDYFQTFSPTPKMTTLRVLLHVAAQRNYKLHSLDFSSAFLQGSLHEKIWPRRPPGFTGSFPAGIKTTLAALGFTLSTADTSLFIRTDTSLPAFYALVYLGLQITRDRARRTITLTQSHMVHQIFQRFGFQFSSPHPTPLSTGHSLSAPPSDESVEPSGPYPELVGCLMYLMTCTRPDLAYPLSLLARYVAPSRHRKVHCDTAKKVLRYLCSTSGMGLVLGGRDPVVLTGHADAFWVDDSATQRSSQGYTFSLGAMAAQELRWLTYLLTDLEEQPQSPSVLYVDYNAMTALCQEHRLEHRTKHIALRYFLARELQQRGQLRFAYVATRVNTVDIITKTLPPGDHQRFSTVLGFLSTLPHLLTA
ncbi:unnamed protein product [Closterium sp. NIES-54]